MRGSSLEDIKEMSDKHFELYMIMNRWTRLLQDKKSVVDYFKRNNYRKIAIYGFNFVGETLERELRDSGIKIDYIIDRNAEYMYAPVKLISPKEKYNHVDIMVVTVYDKSNKLINDLRSMCDFKVVFIGDVLKEV